jgi:hypothetical protein
MNIRELEEHQAFLTKLRETPRDWFCFGGVIRRLHGWDSEHCCPITEVAGHRGSNWRRAAWNAGLTFSVAERIANAADDALPTPIRQDLLRACGLLGDGHVVGT